MIPGFALRVVFTLYLSTFAGYQVANRVLIAVCILPAPFAPFTFIGTSITIIPGFALLISFTLYTQTLTSSHLTNVTRVAVCIGPASFVLDTAVLLADMANFALTVVGAFHWFAFPTFRMTFFLVQAILVRFASPFRSADIGGITFISC